MVRPTPAQLRVRDHDALSLIAIAPAGCGKTEALALRIQGFLDRGVVAPPRKVLVTTFSNRARDNIRERLQAYISPAQLRDRVSITNFHGLSARIVRAHAASIGLDPDATLPENDWVGEQCRRRGLSFNAISIVQDMLRQAKQEPLVDGEIDRLLLESGNAHAVEIERLRRRENRLTYDDLPRLAELILQNNQIASLYQSHFAAVVVDEFQDLTPQQLRIVNRIGYRKTTFAGDLAQGIYGFAGARPDVIYAAVRDECDEVIEFAESHRSAPAVLRMVNSLASQTGGKQLTSADPASWPGGGLAGEIGFSDTAAEADWAVRFCKALLARAPEHRVGIIARIASRRRFVDQAVADSGVPYHRWDDGVLDTETAKIMKAMLSQVNARDVAASADPLEFLRDAANLDSIQDPGGREALADAVTWCLDLISSGLTAAEIKSRIRIGDNATLLTVPGVHLLTGHVGKGQQFDWVLVVGAEEGAIPDFRAKTAEAIAEESRVLSVMISRARHGVVVMHAESVPAASSGVTYSKEESRFLRLLREANPFDREHVVDWLNKADWPAIVAR